MSATPPNEPAALPLSLARHLDEVCYRFEAAWKAATSPDRRPRIEDYLVDLPEPGLSELLRELILVDLFHRRRSAEDPQPADYHVRFPAVDLAWLAGAVAARRVGGPPPASAEPAMATSPARRVRCPHCHNPIQLGDEQADEVLCPACGSSFRMRDARQTATVKEMRPLGKFQLLERVGLGAFGAVWRARDTELGRIVALKIPHTGLLTDGAELERFHREARAAAQLRHPGIVTVHEVATLNGLPVIVTDFVEGVPLKDVLELRRLTFREAATLVAEVAEALDYAHRQGLVHRDIKPANIMIEPASRRSSPVASDQEASATDSGLRTMESGQPKILDFGLALREEAEITITMDGQIIGTPAYMSPEQARGKGHEADRRSDIYSLGVVLYELLCGELPFRGSRVMMLQQVLHEEPRPPRRINDKIPRDLETICLKALAKEPHRRYPSAAELVDDLRRFLTGQPIRARPVGTVEKGLRWAKRQPALATLAASVVVLVVGVAVVSSLAAVWLAAARDKALTRLWDSQFAQAQAGRYSGQVGRRFKSLELLAELAKTNPSLEVRNEAIACLVLADLKIAKEWNLDPVYYRGPSFDAKLERYAASDEAGNISVRRVADHEAIARLPGSGIPSWYHHFSPNGQFLAVKYGNVDGRHSSVWDLDQCKVILPVPNTGRDDITCDFSPDNRLLAIGTQRDRAIHLYDLNSGKEELCLTLGFRPSRVRFGPDGRTLAVGGYQTLRIYDLATRETIMECPHPKWVMNCAWRHDGKILAAACEDHHIYLWAVPPDKVGLRDGWKPGFAKNPTSWLQDFVGKAAEQLAGSRQPLAVLKGHQGEVTDIAFNRRGDLLASSSWDGTIRLWDALTGSQLIQSPKGGAVQFFSPDDRFLAFGWDSARIWLWEAAPGLECKTFSNPKRTGGAISPDGMILAYPGSKGVQLWDVATATEIPFFDSGDIRSVFFDPKGENLITAGSLGIHVWPITPSSNRSRRELAIGPPQLLGVPASDVGGAVLSPDGRFLYVVPTAGKAFVWDRQNSARKFSLPAGYGMSFSPDGKWFAAGDWYSSGVRVWDTHTGELVRVLPTKMHTSTRFSLPDGDWLITSTGEDYRFWQTGSWQPGLRIPRQDAGDMPGSIVFTNDGKTMAIAFSRTTVQLVDPSTGQELATLPTVGGPLCFTPDGHYLVTAGEGSTIQVWDLRRIRVQLAAMGLDWDPGRIPPAGESPGPEPLKAKVLLGELAPRSKRPAQDKEMQPRP